ncbi:sodium/potassium-transporting ATPase subunit beta-2-like [Neocloeon triangulifer]|uniref:sodium/potassium-transporting ATPase subunit beta-2-like n=1 Tax=Neocloeon triangulifer TaxID=2078957 RepID=UPI00286F9081|nr:sodium/potassium-transporting ATPase subunit beta-2-like [Neocloeon triangulifer]
MSAPVCKRRFENEKNGADKMQPAAGMHFVKPEDQTACEKIGEFIYDPKKGAILTRTPSSWAKIFLFYLIFYSCLAGMAVSLMYIFLTNNIYGKVGPCWELSESRIGTNPGLGYRPMSHRTVDHFSLLIVDTKFRTQLRYIKQLDEFLKPYNNLLGQHRQICDHERVPQNRSLTSCSVDISQWDPCTAQHGYGYNQSAPCVFLKLNRIFNWVPEFYNSSDELPEDMPKDLKEHITKVSNTEHEKLNMIWITCEGEMPDDKEHIGKIKYIPDQGFPGYYYPFLNTTGYLSPLVAVHFVRPQTGVIIKVECRVWAKNLLYDRRELTASVKFQLFVE